MTGESGSIEKKESGGQDGSLRKGAVDKYIIWTILSFVVIIVIIPQLPESGGHICNFGRMIIGKQPVVYNFSQSYQNQPQGFGQDGGQMMSPSSPQQNFVQGGVSPLTHDITNCPRCGQMVVFGPNGTVRTNPSVTAQCSGCGAVLSPY